VKHNHRATKEITYVIPRYSTEWHGKGIESRGAE
jgi:hypothetical protein